jgi:ATP-binding cassette subfamily B protein RaxB
MFLASLLRGLRARTLPVVRQVEGAECGLACLAMIAGFHGHKTDLPALRRRFSFSLKGGTLKSLVDIGADLGLASRAVRCELDELGDLRLPAILHWSMKHFVVLKRVRGRTLDVHDPANGARSIGLDEASLNFTGIALEMWPNEHFEKTSRHQALSLSDLVTISWPVWSALARAMVLSVLIEIFSLAAPFYMQLVVDAVVAQRNVDLLATLAVGFAGLQIFNVAARALRSLTLQFVSNRLSMEMQAGIFHHLLRLPLDWFQKRHIGDIQSRFSSLQPIQEFISKGAIAALFDGLLGFFVLAFMFYYSVGLTAIVLAATLLYAAIRFGTVRLSQQNTNNWLVASSDEQTRFLETVRAVHTVKAAGVESMRESVQLNAIAATLNAGLRLGNFNIAYGAASHAISGLTDILVVFLAAKAVMQGSLTIGMLTAFLAYKAQFAERCTGVVEQLISWRLLDVQLERLSDVVLQPPEVEPYGGGLVRAIGGTLECRKVSFRYAESEPCVFEGFDLSVGAGEFVVITGPSGCGKSTILKVLTGLYKPTDGEVMLDGVSLTCWNRQSLRRQIAFVSQDDQMLVGSLADNIAFFQDEIDLTLVEECARMANVHEEIAAMPMAYRSLVGDMGSVLSGGQKQRVMIARALYRRPRILVLDEATSHLDIENERAINASLRKLSITRLVVAHRPETIRLADREIRLGPPFCEIGPESRTSASRNVGGVSLEAGTFGHS